MKVLFRCGHSMALTRQFASEPVCPQCGKRGIESMEMPPPRIVGTAKGPHVTTVDLPAVAQTLTK